MEGRGRRPCPDRVTVSREAELAPDTASRPLRVQVDQPDRLLRRPAAGAGDPGHRDGDVHSEPLARDLHARLQALGVYKPERREWLPHVTVIRFRRRPRLQPPLPELEPFVPSDAAVYLSRLRPGGAQYEVLESVALGGR